MKNFFLSIIAVLGSLFGFHSQTSQPIQPIQPTTNIPVVSISTTTQSTSTTAVPTPSKPVQSTIITPTQSSQPIPPIITYPLGYEVLHPGQTYAVTWQNKDSRAINYSINLEFVTTNGYYFIALPLGTASSTAQTLAFTIPANFPSRTNYQIYFSNAANKSDVIVGTPAFTIK
jgi:hypothetical protein